MDLDPTTFALEIINFLVLLWLLQRFLFRPVRASLQQRAAAAAAQAQALAEEKRRLQADASELARRQAELDALRGQAEHRLADEMAVERQQRLAALDSQLQAEREKALARERQDQERHAQQAEREARERAAAFVADYLRRLASPALEAAIVELFLADLKAQADQARTALADAAPEGSTASPLAIATAFDPPPALRERVQAQLQSLAGPAAPRWQVEPALLAGICVHAPGHQLEASLRRGVDAFTGQPA